MGWGEWEGAPRKRCASRSVAAGWRWQTRGYRPGLHIPLLPRVVSTQKEIHQTKSREQTDQKWQALGHSAVPCAWAEAMTTMALLPVEPGQALLVSLRQLQSWRSPFHPLLPAGKQQSLESPRPVVLNYRQPSAWTCAAGNRGVTKHCPGTSGSLETSVWLPL